MVLRSLSALVALVPAIAFANAIAAEDPETAALDSMSVTELCAARSSENAWAELERRDVFSDRELRAIRRERVRDGISEQALRCFKGVPDDIIGEISVFESGPVDAFVYASGTAEPLVAYILREVEGATVVKSVETEDPYLYAPKRPRDESIAYDGFTVLPGGMTVPVTAGTRHHSRAVSSNSASGEYHPPQ